MIVAIGATPVGMPPTQMAEAMQKGSQPKRFNDLKQRKQRGGY
jgi:hypothetical protein